MNCQNCKAKLSCGCQQRVASDKASVCTNCAQSYENMLKVKKNNSAKLNAPSNLQVGLTHTYKK